MPNRTKTYKLAATAGTLLINDQPYPRGFMQVSYRGEEARIQGMGPLTVKFTHYSYFRDNTNTPFASFVAFQTYLNGLLA